MLTSYLSGVSIASGTIDVMNYIRAAPSNSIESIEFLTPCHATPYYSHIHRRVPMHFLDCSPALARPHAVATADRDRDSQSNIHENDRFFADPLAFVTSTFSTTTSEPQRARALPSHFVLFEPAAAMIASFFQDHGYRECARFFHTWTPLDSKQGDVLVFCNSRE